MATVSASAATNVGDTSATFHGIANPAGVASYAWFEYGPTTAYGSETAHVYVGNGAVDVPIAATVHGLASGHIYHYRAVLAPGAAPPPATYGDDLPDRLAESAGSTINVASTAALTAALGSAANGSIINITASLNGGGQQLQISRVASAAAPITITCDPGVLITNFSQWYVTGQYLRFRGLDISGSTLAGIKFDGAANNNEIDSCVIHNNLKMGILVYCVTYPDNIQIWNCIIYGNGSTSNGILDHGIYFGTAALNGARRCVVANCLLYDNCTFNLQIYPHTPGVIVTCCTGDGGVVHPTFAHTRGGFVYSDDNHAETHDCLTVGCISTNAPNFYGFGTVGTFVGANNNFYDCIGFGDSAGSFDPVASKMIFDASCTTVDPLYENRAAKNFHLQGGSPAIDYVDPARYGYVPPLDIDGNPRVTADAGCYAA